MSEESLTFKTSCDPDGLMTWTILLFHNGTNIIMTIFKSLLTPVCDDSNVLKIALIVIDELLFLTDCLNLYRGYIHVLTFRKHILASAKA